MACSHPHPVPGSVHDGEGPYVLRYWLCQCGHIWSEQSVKVEPKPRVYPIQPQAVAR